MWCLLFFLIIGFALPSAAQEDRYTWDDFVEELTTDEEVAEEEDWTLFLEELKMRHEHPFNINTATREELSLLPFLSESQIEQIHAYIYLHGTMKSLGELRLVPFIDEDIRRKLSLFVFVGEPADRKVFRGIGRPEGALSTRTDLPLYYRRGYQVENGYSGDPLYQRIKFNLTDHRHLQVDARIEKDPGERYYDAFGASLTWQKMGILRKAIAGDYRIAFGEGLVVGGSRQYSKASLNMKPFSGLRSMTSMDEVRFLRGGAVMLGLGPEIQLTAFGSYRQMDATLNAQGQVQTLLTTGYHRTQSERNSRRKVGVAVAGGNIGWKHGGIHLGLTGYWQHFNRTLNPGTQLYRRYYPAGTDFGVVGLNYGYAIYRLTMAGETAYSTARGGVGTLHRISWLINRRYTLSAVQRYYNRRYHSFQAAAFGENSTVQNESGVMVQLKAQPLEHWLLLCYADFFHSPWPRYRMTHSSSGQEFMGQLTWQPYHSQSLSLRYQLKRKENADIMEPHHRLKGQWNVALGRSEAWSMKTAALLHRVLGRSGWAVQETVRFTSPRDQWRLSLMGGYFHTADYLSRIYLYEPSLWSSVSSGSYYGKGFHGVFTARWTSRNAHWMLEAKYALTRYTDRSEQGSGLQTIYSPWKNDLSAQVKWMF